MKPMECPPPPPRSLYFWTKSVLRSLGHVPVEWMDQVFLVNGYSIAEFAKIASRIANGGDVAEVGPGLGSLTIPLSTMSKRLVAIELDRRLALFLERLVNSCGSPNVVIVAGDGPELLESVRVSAVVSNTPYSASSRIIAAMARNNNVRNAVLGVQLDVARRMIAEPGSTEYGRLTLLTKRYFRAEIKMVIPKSHYYPRPKVDGAIVEMERIKPWEKGDEVFEKLTACLFAQRNKRASKAIRECSERVLGRAVSVELGEKRVRDLDPSDIELVISKACPAQGS